MHDHSRFQRDIEWRHRRLSLSLSLSPSHKSHSRTIGSASALPIILILKTIGNRKGDCAWSCSRWQTQPEKICKSQRTNQCHSLPTLYWFVRCDLQIFSGCVCHLEQLHAQSPFLFPIVFSINLIPFFDICSVDYLLFFHPGCSGMCCFTWAAARLQQLLWCQLPKFLEDRRALRLCTSPADVVSVCCCGRVGSNTEWFKGSVHSSRSSVATLRQADHEWITRARARMSCMERVLTRCSIFLAWSMSTKWYWVNHGRLTSESKASASHRHSSINQPCCSSGQAPSFLSLQSCTRTLDRLWTRRRAKLLVFTERVTIMHSNTRQALNASTRQASCLYWTRRSAKLLVFTIMHSNTRQALRVDAFGLHEMVLGKSRQAHQRTIMHSNTRQAKSRHRAHQRTIMHSNTRQALNASVRSSRNGTG